MGSACRDGGECGRNRRLRVAADVAAASGTRPFLRGNRGPDRADRPVTGPNTRPDVKATGVLTSRQPSRSGSKGRPTRVNTPGGGREVAPLNFDRSPTAAIFPILSGQSERHQPGPKGSVVARGCGVKYVVPLQRLSPMIPPAFLATVPRFSSCCAFRAKRITRLATKRPAGILWTC